jgi:hypothetical protein
VTPPYSYETCPIEPWAAEIVNRMHEAAALGTAVVNLSYTHPRGFIPNQILRRPPVRKILSGWSYNAERLSPVLYPDRVWLSGAGLNLDYCPTAPFEREIALRENEAIAAVRTGLSSLPLIDLTNWHPRGGIPLAIVARLERRKSKVWREEAASKVASLYGEANQAEGLAKSMREKAAGLADNGKDPAAMLAAVTEQNQRAEMLRQQARFFKQELEAHS